MKLLMWFYLCHCLNEKYVYMYHACECTLYVFSCDFEGLPQDLRMKWCKIIWSTWPDIQNMRICNFVVYLQLTELPLCKMSTNFMKLHFDLLGRISINIFRKWMYSVYIIITVINANMHYLGSFFSSAIINTDGWQGFRIQAFWQSALHSQDFILKLLHNTSTHLVDKSTTEETVLREWQNWEEGP